VRALAQVADGAAGSGGRPHRGSDVVVLARGVRCGRSRWGARRLGSRGRFAAWLVVLTRPQG
jgi:hypothetical protein